MMNTRWIASLGLVALVLGCGDSDGDKSTGPDPQTQTIRIGLLTELADLWEPFGLPFERSAQLAISEINASGGVLGRQLELVSLHSTTDADAVKANARTLIDSDVVAIVGPTFSEFFLVVAQDVSIPANMLLISPSVTSAAVSDLEGDGLIWRTIASDALTGSVAGAYAHDTMGNQTAGILFLDNIFGLGLAAAFEADFVARGGQILAREALPDLASADVAAYDYREHIDIVTADKPDVLFIATRESANDKISIGLQSVFNEDYHAQLLTSANRSDDWLTNADPTVTEGMRGILAAPAVETAAFLGYASRLQAAYGIDPTLFADSVYDCIYLLALAIEQGTFSTSLAIGANLQSVSVSGATILGNEFSRARELITAGSDIDYVGASGPVDLNANGDVVSGNFSVWEIQNGRFVDIENISFP
ncbi:MAG: ABC transporter substrate-binding protein [Gemmatimonadetes bacterium]|jgi:branched-chain amino acid transport system substrate-binding protein|nr:ABC transporter substrate-binding protein [Gemmatimonadota bacterium]MBT4609456.1 ABC transporter substrate-binding protein [Gemmatimonadota bacterium]MBT5060393.1 ABC transporter substrate-binding protein [Gemmatimonadota bacterium]MBT5146048.1 ABC transporter substrate-binding protein [Gemmatimonadota bacterium]MBT5591873.1 ABC transporter substrate-binding protein [Gemmatimonadota bacterium]